MDRETQTVIRSLKATGNLTEAVLILLDDFRLSELQRVRSHIAKLIGNWRNKQVQRAMEMSIEELHEFKMLAVNPRWKHDVPITEIKKHSDFIKFISCFPVKHEMTYINLSLVNDLNYNFGIQNLRNDHHLYPGDTFNHSFVLEEH